MIPGSIRQTPSHDFAQACAAAGGALVAVDGESDRRGLDRPPAAAARRRGPPQAAVLREKAAAKIARVRAALNKVDGLVISDAHDAAWLFNIRGSDVAHTPLPLCFAILPSQGRPKLYIDGRKVPEALHPYLSKLADLAEPDRLVEDLAALGVKGARLAFDAATAPARLTQALEAGGGKAEVGVDPIALMKAAKNEVELDGARAAHLRDGAAVARFLAWFDRAAPEGDVTEIDAAQALETFRRDTGRLKDISFPTISGTVRIPRCRIIGTTKPRTGASRAAYFSSTAAGNTGHGTTDITRTIAVGKPGAGKCATASPAFSRGISRSRERSFPAASAGRRSTAMRGRRCGRRVSTSTMAPATASVPISRCTRARSASPRPEPRRSVPGMIVSNEPGYYAAGKFGIRIENLVIVAPRAIPGAERDMLGFETITLAPIDVRLVAPKLLSADEIAWLDAYHARVRRTVGPLVDRKTRAWLKAATRPLAR